MVFLSSVDFAEESTEDTAKDTEAEAAEQHAGVMPVRLPRVRHHPRRELWRVGPPSSRVSFRGNRTPSPASTQWAAKAFDSAPDPPLETT